MQIRLILTDFDGTLVDTKEANFMAYCEVLKEFGYALTSEKYNAVFGLRLNEFLECIGITNPKTVEQIRQQKKNVYPRYFSHVRLNKTLLDFITRFKTTGCKIGLVSTAQRHNILKILEYFSMMNQFDIIVSGNEISIAKPDPSAYIYAMKQIGCKVEETLIFEDSNTGIEAAKKAGSAYIKIDHAFFEH